MSNKGTIIGAPIKQVDINSLYPVAFGNDINGGLHFRTTIADRNLMPLHLREWGMMVYVESESKTYQLKQNNMNKVDNINWVEFSGSGGGSSDPFYFTVTKSELDDLIDSGELIPGAMYNIVDVDSDLYNGSISPLGFPTTSIWLKAISQTELDCNGVGKFHNPKYNYDLHNNGIYSNILRFEFDYSGSYDLEYRDFNYTLQDMSGEINITMIGKSTTHGIAESSTLTLLEIISEEVYGSSYFGNLDVISATSDIMDPISGDILDVIWGGYYWSNKTGLLGSVISDFELSGDWGLKDYDINDYYVSFDTIKYDYETDKIYSRSDSMLNKVEYDFRLLNESVNNGTSIFDFVNPIKHFQWTSIGEYNKGVSNNNISNSIFNNINSMVKYTTGVVLKDLSIFKDNIVLGDMGLENLTLDRSTMIGNNLIDSNLECVKLIKSNFSNNTAISSYINNLDFMFSSEINLMLESYTSGSYVDPLYVSSTHGNVRLLNYDWNRVDDPFEYNEYNEHIYTEKKGAYRINDSVRHYYGYDIDTGSIVLVNKPSSERHIFAPNDTTASIFLIEDITITNITINNNYHSILVNTEAFAVGEHSFELEGYGFVSSFPYDIYANHEYPVILKIKTPGLPIDVTMSYIKN